MFHDAISSLTTIRSDLAERARDEFGASILEDVLDPMLTQLQRLDQLWEETREVLRGIDQTLQEIESMGRSA